MLPGFARADEPTITVTVGGETRTFTRDQLLARPDATTIQVPFDITYRVPMAYRAVPVASLLDGMTLPPESVIEAIALDGFIAQLPLDLVLNKDESKAVAWLAIEPADHPWRTFLRRRRARDRFTSRGPEPRSTAFGASNGRFRWQSS